MSPDLPAPLRERDAPLSPLERSLARAVRPMLVLGALTALTIRYLVQGSTQLPDFSGYLATIGLDPMNAGGFAALFFLFLVARPPVGMIQLALLLGGIAESLYLLSYLPYNMPVSGRLLAAGAGFGVVGFLCLLALTQIAESEPAKIRAKVFCWASVLLVLYPFFASALFGSISVLAPMVHDQAGYLVEGCLGFVPSFEIAHFLAQYPSLDWSLQSIYNRLSTILVLGLGFSVVHERRCYTNIFFAFAISAILANFFYLLLPMVGIDDFVGRPLWPGQILPPPTEPVAYLAAGNLPRTCYPSLHGTWILIPFFVLCRSTRPLAFLFGSLAGLTIVAAMGPLVGHYLLDMMAAVPFVVACLAIAAHRRPGNRHQRWACMGFGLGATLVLALAIRWAPVNMANHPWLSWGGMVAMVLVSLWLENRLARATLEEKD